MHLAATYLYSANASSYKLDNDQRLCKVNALSLVKRQK